MSTASPEQVHAQLRGAGAVRSSSAPNVERPDTVYGRLTEGVHIAGYSFERAMINLEWLLEEDRWQRVSPGFEDVNLFLASIRLDCFRPVAEQRKRLVRRIKELQPEASQRRIAGTLGVGEATIGRDLGTRSSGADASHVAATETEKPHNHAESDLRSASNDAPRDPWVIHNTGNVEWYTPERVLELVRAALGGIDLDPASHEAAQERVQAKRYYTAEDDGLAHEWRDRVYLNPPYAHPLVGQFVEKLIGELDVGRVSAAITLTNNATDTRWAQALLAKAALVCLPSGRLRYWTPEKDGAAALQGQMLCYLGDKPARFRAVFGELGAVLRPVRALPNAEAA